MKNNVLVTELFVREIAALPHGQLGAVTAALEGLNSNPDYVTTLSADELLYQFQVDGVGALLFARQSEPDQPLLAVAFVPLAAKKVDAAGV